MKKYRIECTEEQLHMIANCVEDCSRFAAGQMELWNTTSRCAFGDNYYELHFKLRELQPLMTPALGRGSSYSWFGGNCPNEPQRKFIAKTYGIYREILHYLNRDAEGCNVYKSETLTCKDSVPLIKVEEIK